MPVRTTPGNGIEIAYETFGDSGARPLLLVMGLGTQMLAWHEDFCAALVDRGFFVVRFDNRDVGLSTHLHDAPAPDVMAALGGDLSSASYRLEDLADDTAGLLDALGIDTAHVVGASMGGMVAQTLALTHRPRVRSLTSIMSTPSPQVGSPTAEALAVLLSAPATSRKEAVQRTLTTYGVIGSPGYPLDEEWLAAIAGESYDRGYDAAGVARQLLAIHASGDRTQALRSLDVPTLVVHGPPTRWSRSRADGRRPRLCRTPS
jgi:pimeloyl-ACP methyl ester carboxylesterase